MRPADDIKRFIDKAAVSTNPKADKAVLDIVLAAQEKATDQTSAAPRPSLRGIVMRSPITKFAVAAVVLLSVALLIHSLGGAPDGASVTFAQVLAQIREFRPYAYTQTRRYYQSDRVEVRRKMILNEYQRREELPGGLVWIFDYSREPVGMLQLDPATKQAIWETFADQKVMAANPNILETLRRFEENPDTYRTEDRGIQKTDGHRTKCFQVLVEGYTYTYAVWVDIKTKLPVRIELDRPAAKDTLIMTDFDFAPQFDVSQFDRVPPPGYTLSRHIEAKPGSVSAQANAFRPRSYTMTAQSKDGTTQVSRVLEPSFDRRRCEYANGVVEIYDFSQQPCRMLRLDTGKKQGTLETYPDQRPTRINPDLLDTLQKAQAAPEKYKVEDRGVQTLEGHTTRCLYVAGARNEIECTFWVDTGTGLLVRAEMRRGEDLILTDFEFDVSFDPGLFELKAPEGYTLQEVGYPAKVDEPTETHLANGLRAIAEFVGGVFPQDLDWPGIQEQMRAYVLANKVDISPDQLKDLRVALEPFLEYVGRLRSSPGSFDLHYVGGGVHLGEAQTAILWYRPQGMQNYHVVYGDLRVEEVAPESLPQKWRPTQPQEE
jgi:outer membrane lipoprotein-sorting protein